MSRALVLAGGGVAGIAWLLGLIEALRDDGLDLTTAEQLVGTSAGSVVATQIATSQLAAAIAMQEREQSAERFIDVDLEALFAKAAVLSRGASGEHEILRRWGTLALETATISEAERRAVVAARLPVQRWPERPLTITAVGTATGELTVFDRDAGVDLVDAVTASCAVPGVWPPHTIGDQRYMDGGARSFTNADLARGSDRVVILVPVASTPMHAARLEREVATLSNATVIFVDADAIAAIGPNPLDPSRRRPALEAGRRQARAVAAELRTSW